MFDRVAPVLYSKWWHTAAVAVTAAAVAAVALPDAAAAQGATSHPLV
jgi:hypothetical protein